MFLDAMRKYPFSYSGLQALYSYLDELSEDMGEDIEFDPVGIAGSYTEYPDIQEAGANYNITGSDEAIIEELRDNTTVIGIEDGGIIIEDF